MIKRDKYLHLLIKNRKNGFPKIITGIRRCGKSYLLQELFRAYLIEDGVPEKNILILALDEDKNAKYRDPILLGQHVRDYCKEKKDCYVILDEIQKVFPIVNPLLTEGKHVSARNTDTEVITFVDTILGLSREKNIDLYVTGSNSKMLSSDILTEFRDKAVNISIAPLSFEEFFGYKGGSETEAIYEYMQYGGMPLAVLKDYDEKRDYLRGLFETTYFRDIIEHNHLRKSESLDELCNILSSTTGELLNADKIANTYRSVKKEKLDRETIERYIGYFTDAFILKEAKRYDVKGRVEIGALRKYYFSDPGLRNARLNFAFPDEGQMLENIVYNELIYKGYTVNVGTFDTIEKDSSGKSIRKTNEIDFIANKGNRQYYIQVAADISETSTMEREQRPYMMINDQIKKLIVINKPIKESLSERGFTIIGITDFLLSYI